MASRQRTLEQERGNHAWQKVSDIQDKSFRTEYRALVRKLPSHIMLTGLGQTLAFLQAKAGSGSNEHHALERHLSEWVVQELTGKALKESGYSSLLLWILNAQRTTDDYRRATSETLAYVAWLKRFAEALIPENSL
ncbi:MAG: type III-B CRISPR module-associated protein Cmr5 [Ardenticatenales bacterium]|nr:type III-B CRISPR module-associated protein Cmr5 [Ardenticatenales bacterium]